MTKGDVFTTGIRPTGYLGAVFLCSEVNGEEVVVHNVFTTGKAELRCCNADGSHVATVYAFPDEGGMFCRARLHSRHDLCQYYVVNLSASAINIYADGVYTGVGATGANKGDIFFSSAALTASAALDVRPAVNREAVIHNISFANAFDLCIVDEAQGYVQKLDAYSAPTDGYTSFLGEYLHITRNNYLRLVARTAGTSAVLVDGVYTK